MKTSNSKITLRILLLTSSIIGILSLVNRNDSVNPRIEETALNLLISQLDDSLLFKRSDVLLPPEFEKDMIFFNKKMFYSNGKLCLITNPEYVYYKTANSDFLDNYKLFSVNRDSIVSTDYIAQSITLPSVVKRITFKKFITLENEKAYFFTIRHHLLAGKVSDVQIHMTPYSKSYNPYEYTFHVYFYEGEMTHWNISLADDFEFEIDC